MMNALDFVTPYCTPLTRGILLTLFYILCVYFSCVKFISLWKWYIDSFMLCSFSVVLKKLSKFEIYLLYINGQLKSVVNTLTTSNNVFLNDYFRLNVFSNPEVNTCYDICISFFLISLMIECLPLVSVFRMMRLFKKISM